MRFIFSATSRPIFSLGLGPSFSIAAICAALLAGPSAGRLAAQSVATPTAASGEPAAETATPTAAEQQFAKIRKSMANAESSAEKIATYRAEIDAVAGKIKSAREELAQPIAIEVSATAQGVDELNLMLTDLRGRAQNLENEAAALARRPDEAQKRLGEIPGELSAAESKLQQILDQPTTPPDDADAPPTTGKLTEQELLSLNPADATESEIAQAQKQSRIRELRLQIDALQTEREYYKATAGSTPVQQAVMDRRLQQTRSQIDRTVREIEQKKRAEAERQNDRLQDAVSMVPESLRPLAQSNVDLASLHQRLLDQVAANRSQLKKITEAHSQVKTDLETAQSRIDSVGLTDALGLSLRRKREQNQALRFKFGPQVDLRDTLAELQIETFNLQDEAAELAETEIAAVQNTESVAPVDWSTLDERQSRELLIGRRRTLILDTLATLETLTNAVLTVDTDREQLVQSVNEYTDFVDGHLFWIRSAPAAGQDDLAQFDEAAKWLLDGKNWTGVLSHVTETAIIMPLRTGSLLLISLAMIVFRRRMRRNMTSAPSTGRGRMPTRQTLMCVFWTIASASVWPVCVGSLAIVVVSITTSDPMVHGVGLGLAVGALYVASRNLLKEMCVNDGLGDAHFGWSSTVRKLVRRHLIWYTSIGGVSLFLLAVYHEHPNIVIRTIGTRWMSINLFVLTSLFNHFLLRPGSSVYSQIARRNPESIWVKLQKPVWAVAVILPIVFAMLSLGGYLETAFQLGRSLQRTFLLLIVLIIVAGVVDRAFRLRRREEARREHMRLLAAEANANATSTDATETPAGVPSDVSDICLDDEAMSVETLDRQSRQLASLFVGVLAIAGLSLIWKDVFPAVAFMDGLEVYGVGENEDRRTVSLLNAMITVLIGGIFYYAIRNLPSLVEFVVLRRTSLDSGAKYAVVTLMRYVLLIVGTIWFLNRLLVPYEQLGWLLTAASVGLGFGLQEIVANFVSGIILLLERPVRVGDVVTIDGQTGLVSKIQMRSTTVTNWDRKELVIPNKDLITEKLLNWSLSNVVNRLVLNVGVAYGSDPDKVRAILRDVVLSHPDVLPDPSPMVNLDTFGDSSLNFVIRCFLPNLDNRLEVTHQINTRIAERFKEENIEIPFPQMDVHMDRR